MKALMLITIPILIHAAAHAELDSNAQDALEKTKELLKDKEIREKAIAKDPKAVEADKKAKALVGEKHTDEIYDIAAQLMDKITEEANGDPDKMQKLIQEANLHPEQFYKKYFNEDQKTKVRDLATKIQDDSPRVGPAK